MKFLFGHKILYPRLYVKLRFFIQQDFINKLWGKQGEKILNDPATMHSFKDITTVAILSGLASKWTQMTCEVASVIFPQ